LGAETVPFLQQVVGYSALCTALAAPPQSAILIAAVIIPVSAHLVGLNSKTHGL